ncbi:hypothetical protein BJ170DRAFT_2170 [Xylariales sp. AK1849]|nr:hypothetical protein BJ170DRAFT_2170 [Xylariales sp. AK1849]
MVIPSSSKTQRWQSTYVSVPIMDDIESGRRLRRSLVDGTLSAEAQHALMTKPQLRIGLVGCPVAVNVSRAIISGPMNSGLRPLLLSELHKVSNSALHLPTSSRGQQRKGHVDQDETSSRHTSSTLQLGDRRPNVENSISTASPSKKLLTIKRSNVPERPSLSSVMNRSTSSIYISRAPFETIGPVPVESPISPEPARIMSDIVLAGTTQTGMLTLQDGDTPTKKLELMGNIAGILRGSSAESQGVKRKRDDNLGVTCQTSVDHQSQNPQEVRTPSAPSSGLPQPSSYILGKSTTGLLKIALSSYKPKDSSLDPAPQAQPRQPWATGQELTMALPDFNTTSMSTSRKHRVNDNIVSSRGRHMVSGRCESRVSSSADSSHGDPQSDTNIAIVDTKYSTPYSGNDSEYKMEYMDNDTDIEEPISMSSKPAMDHSGFSAEGGRPYNVWRLPCGREVLTYGALLPTGYLPQEDNERPWICPVRSCRILFGKLESLGGHFNSGHRATALNDNGDGTLSIINFREGKGRKPAIVVSKEPLDPREPPMPDPSLPPQHKDAKKPRQPLSSEGNRSRALQSRASARSIDNTPGTTERRSGRIAKECDSLSLPNTLATYASTSKARQLQNSNGARQNQSVLKESPAAYGPSSSITNHDDALDIAMEDWEIAPGRIRNESSAEIENIAFSATYLVHGDEVSIGRDIGFHVLFIKPGTTHRFKGMDDRVRLCSIATGKVKVKTCSQEFDVGPNGMFQVKPGKTCVVENRFYSIATLHVTAVPSEFPA